MTAYQPLLSICIPTWNRAHLLGVTLENLRKEIRGLEMTLEIVIADNASTDGTAAVVQACGYPVTYGKQMSTVGITRNIFFATCDLAQGEFVWLVGDDDLITPGGVRRVVESLQREPSLDYHYINFGWIDVDAREEVVRQLDGVPPASVMQRSQFDLHEWRRLEKAEELAYVPATNPSSLFSGIFCYAARRDFYIDARQVLNPTDSLDGSSTVLADNFPQVMITVPRIVGKPIAYIGVPCLLQGVGGWEWKDYATKTTILGQHDMLNWLESADFDPEALEYLRCNFTQVVGSYFPRMLLYPDAHLGAEAVIERAIPFYSSKPAFWQALMSGMQSQMQIESDARLLILLWEQVNSESKRVGLLGLKGRGAKMLAISSTLRGCVSWVGDNDLTQEGKLLEGCNVAVSRGDTLQAADLDILLLAIKAESIPAVMTRCLQAMRQGTCIICIEGVTQVNS